VTEPGIPDATDTPGGPPFVRVLRGNPTDEELATLVAVVAAVSGSGPDEPVDAPRSEWAAHARRVRATHRHAPGAWRASAFPR
jgi:hypothetical protein